MQQWLTRVVLGDDMDAPLALGQLQVIALLHLGIGDRNEGQENQQELIYTKHITLGFSTLFSHQNCKDYWVYTLKRAMVCFFF